MFQFLKLAVGQMTFRRPMISLTEHLLYAIEKAVLTVPTTRAGGFNRA
jgi:hypothetical protein